MIFLSRRSVSYDKYKNQGFFNNSFSAAFNPPQARTAPFDTPPFGFALFYMKGVASPRVKIRQICTGIIPFVLLQLTGLALIMAFPEIAMWLPRQLLN